MVSLSLSLHFAAGPLSTDKGNLRDAAGKCTHAHEWQLGQYLLVLLVARLAAFHGNRSGEKAERRVNLSVSRLVLNCGDTCRKSSFSIRPLWPTHNHSNDAA